MIGFEMWIFQRMERVRWMEHSTNEKILHMVEENRSLISSMKKMVGSHNEGLHCKNYK